MHAQKDVLHNVIDVALRAHAARDERTQLGLELAPSTARC
jgi:hypothetical protein